MNLDHVALLVADIEPALERARALGLTPGPIEEFPGEGTREVYLGSAPLPARLLLIQPAGADGPYARALAKRGPGLHHLGYTVPALDAFLATLSGWLLHPVTLASVIQSRTAWLARPGVPTLVEVHERNTTYEGEPVVAKVELPAPSELAGLLELEGLALSPDDSLWLTVAGRRVSVEELV